MIQQDVLNDLFSNKWGSKIPSGKFLSVEQDTYRTNDGIAYFSFRFEEVDDHIEIDILEQPSYGLRPQDDHSTHRLSSARGGYKICFGDPDYIQNYNAKKWAAAWAEATWKYIRTGKTF